MTKENGTPTTVASPEVMAQGAAQAINDGEISRLIQISATRGSGHLIGILRGAVPPEALRVRQRIMGQRYGGCTVMLNEAPTEEQGNPPIWPTQPDPANPQAFWVEAIGLPQINDAEAPIEELIPGATPLGAVNPQGELLDWNTVLAKMNGSQYRTE